MARRWTEEEFRKLREYSTTVSQREAATLLGRSCDAIKKKTRLLGIKWERRDYTYWSKEEEYLLYMHIETKSTREIAKRLNRSYDSVKHKLIELGITVGQGSWTAARIAREVGCTDETAVRMITILYPGSNRVYRGSHKGKRYILDEEQAERVIKVLRGIRKYRTKLIEGGRRGGRNTWKRKGG